MAFCTNCGKEITEGTKFCPNCGAQVGSGVTPDRVVETQNARQQDMGAATNQQDMEAAGTQLNMYAAQPQVHEPQSPYVPTQPMPQENGSGLDKFGKFYGIVLLVLAIVDFNSDPPIVTILLSVLIIAGAVFCLRKKYKLKGFTIIALILAAVCLFSGIGQAGKYGLFTTPKEYEYSSGSGKDGDAASGTEDKETVAESSTETKDTKETAAPAKEDSSKEATAKETAEDPAAAKETAEDAATAKDETKKDETKKDEPAKDQPADDSSSNSEKAEKAEKSETTNGVDPDLKAFLDSYEDYIDEYVDFMKKYNSDPNNMISMLGEYGDMMQKYSDFAEKLDQYDSDNMSAADYKYYIEVTTRCTQKMLEAY